MKSIRLCPERIYHPGRQEYEHAEIRVANGRILAIEKHLNPIEGEQVVALPGMTLTPGWIDIHVHANPMGTVIGLNPDQVGILRGSPIVFDAGTVGTDQLDDYVEKMIKTSNTDVKILLNISRIGLQRLDEGSNPEWIDEDAIRKAVAKYPDLIVGIKARASGSVVGDQGIEPIRRAKVIAKDLKLPLVVHIGNQPPKVEEVLALLDDGDVITHCFHNKPNGLFDFEGNLISSALAAKERGVMFDVGHGSASFSFEIAERAQSKGFIADFISTDLYEKNMDGPVISLSNVMDKMIQIGMSVEDVIDRVTEAPAEVFKLKGYGRFEIGGKAKMTAYSREYSQTDWTDSVGVQREGKERFAKIWSIIDGEVTKWEGYRCQKSLEK
ncbi:amidohydrolase/deacetylase family metallohydrolase [Gottschalkiaceae bacterium SANA]|nr:amidohydrolase/deacetylase family metallohydrolase [Gottschalkiaceae bacterium SANA]